MRIWLRSINPTFVFTLMLLSLFLPGIAAIAKASEPSATESIPHVYDEAGLLSTEEAEEIDQLCKDYGDKVGITIIILTHNSSDTKDGDRLIEDFYDNMLYGDSVILLVDMYRRDVIIHAYEQAQTYLHSNRTDDIRSSITPYLTDGEYFKAFKTYIKKSSDYMQDDAELNYDHNYTYDNPYGNTSAEQTAKNVIGSLWFQLLVSLAVGGIVVGVMAFNSGGRMTTGSNTYMDQDHSGLIGRRDDYLRTTVTKVRKPTNNNQGNGGFNAGGFRGGMSSGGHSHSSSRGKF